MGLCVPEDTQCYQVSAGTHTLINSSSPSASPASNPCTAQPRAWEEKSGGQVEGLSPLALQQGSRSQDLAPPSSHTQSVSQVCSEAGREVCELGWSSPSCPPVGALARSCCGEWSVLGPVPRRDI